MIYDAYDEVTFQWRWSNKSMRAGEITPTMIVTCTLPLNPDHDEFDVGAIKDIMKRAQVRAEKAGWSKAEIILKSRASQGLATL